MWPLNTSYTTNQRHSAIPTNWTTKCSVTRQQTITTKDKKKKKQIVVHILNTILGVLINLNNITNSKNWIKKRKKKQNKQILTTNKYTSYNKLCVSYS